jgi:hypothetical protein
MTDSIHKSIPTEKIQEFAKELSGFALTAEEILHRIESNPEQNKAEFSQFAQWMIAIRGTAQQLELPQVARIAGLGEEISLKGTTAEKRPQIRKCIGSLWDALTTVKYLLEHIHEETTEEQEILIHRLEATLKAFGGAREKVDANELEALLKASGSEPSSS